MNVIQQLLTKHIDIWTAAETEKKSARGRASGNASSVYGIKKLRDLILELAVRGKLVPQDTNDGSVATCSKQSPLVERQNKKSSHDADPETEKESFYLPSGWVWVRLPQICDYKVGKTPSTKSSVYWAENDGFNWVSIADLNHRGLVSETSRRISDKAALEVFKSVPAPAGTILMSFKLTLGKVSILEKPAFHNEAIISIYPNDRVFKNYLFMVLPARALGGNTKSAIKGNTLNSESIAALTIPLPPLAEQHRIVAKVDELMALCDQLETRHSNAADAHEKLVSHLLGTLTQAQSSEDFSTNWQRISAHFDTLFRTESSIDVLKQTLLQLAVMGKLVPQDANDEPASELLRRIQAEKVRLIAEGKIKKDKPQVTIAENEKPFELPKNWEWVKFDHVAENSKHALKAGPFGSALKKDMYCKSGYKIYGQEQVISGDEKIGDYYIDEKKFQQLSSCAVKSGDILISLVGTIGRVLALSEECEFGIINPRLVKISLFKEINRSYIKIIFASPLLRNEMANQSHGGTMNILNLGLLRELALPLPPIAEQHRIVAKVDELMVLCDQLITKLSDARYVQRKLADVLVEQAA